MLCKKPHQVSMHQYVGCGQCLFCRINRSRIWTHRIMLESMMHDASAFVTLTYNSEQFPEDASLRPRDLGLFWKRIRKYVPVRYYACGEYGNYNVNPHYHACVFGIDAGDQDLVEKCWPHGFVFAGDVTKDSARYITKYITKALTVSNPHNDKILCGRYPEFSRMSNRPGIGAPAMSDVARRLHKHESIYVSSLQHGKRSMPLGKYLEDKLFEERRIDEDVRTDTKIKFELDFVNRVNNTDALGSGSVYSRLLRESEVKRDRIVFNMKNFPKRGRL